MHLLYQFRSIVKDDHGPSFHQESNGASPSGVNTVPNGSSPSARIRPCHAEFSANRLKTNHIGDRRYCMTRLGTALALAMARPRSAEKPLERQPKEIP